MKKKLTGILVAASAVLVTSAFVPAFAHQNKDKTEIKSGSIQVDGKTESQFPGLAGIDLPQAVKDAQTNTPGKVLGVRLEDENGFLVYNVEIVTADNSIKDVKLDAGSGKILAVENDKAEHNGSGDREENESNEAGEQD